MTLLNKIEKNREAFIKFNEAKLQRFQQLITNTAIKRVVNSIPVLLSVNNKKLPGYIEGDVPCGIVGYNPDEDALKFLQARFSVRNFEINSRDPFIEMLAIMGSVGTIAYTKESDFDYWVCIDKRGVSHEHLNNFKRKVELVQNWAKNEIQIDVHLFINDIINIKNNIFAEDESEAFGSTTGAVLKDEFFRSSIIVAGKVPFWWVIPRFVRDNEYYNLFNKLPEEVRDTKFIDLGNLFEISKEDFLGAALFQLIKSLGNPFKSIIKIGVLEKYLFGPDYSPLLSQKVKSQILRGKFDNSILDSYILMFEEVYKYYNSVIEDSSLLKILRQNLYLKINPQLSKYSAMKNRQTLPYKVMVMFKYIKEWGWNINDITELDNFDNWDYNKIMVFWNMVKKFMLISYQKIATQLPSLNLKQKISDSDFKLLSRKIKSHFSSEANKIDQYITFKDTPYESILYIEPTNKSIDVHEWSLSKRNTSEKEKFVSTIIKTEDNLIKLLTWTSINQIFNPTFSRLKFQSGYSRINQNDVTNLMTKISNLFLDKSIPLKNEYFLQQAFNTTNIIIINFGLENEETFKTIYHIYTTSWGESYLDEYHSKNDLIRLLGIILKDGQMLKRQYEDYCLIITPEPFKKHYKDVEQLFREAYEFLVSKKTKQAAHMVAVIGNTYVSVSRDRDKISIFSEPNEIKMFAKISLRPKMDVTHKFFGDEIYQRILNDMFKMRKINSITTFYEERGKTLFVYVFNERGNLYTFVKPAQMKEEVIISLFDFCKNIINRINSYNYLPDINLKTPVFKVTIDKFGKYTISDETQRIEEVYLIKYKVKKSVNISVKRTADRQVFYSLGLQDKMSPDYVPINSIPQAFSRLVMQENSASLMNLVGDVIFEDVKREEVALGTSLHFLEKFRIEFMLEKSNS